LIIRPTVSVEERSFSSYLGVCVGEAVVGSNIVRNVVGDRFGSYERVLRSTREGTTEATAELGADAIIGIALDYEVVGESGSMLMVINSGAAVKLA
jgi:uncharacterized protein YbjQ (UPF0145 family)